MPIEKERLRDLLNAAIAMETALLSITESIKNIILQHRRGQIELKDALDNIWLISDTAKNLNSDESKIIVREQTQWRLTHKRNDRNKLYREEKRRRDGVPQRKPSTTQPQINFDAPSISTQQFLREMEALGMTTEEALREFERKHTEEDEAPQAQAQTPPQTPGDQSRFIEDSDDFAPPTGEC